MKHKFLTKHGKMGNYIRTKMGNYILTKHGKVGNYILAVDRNRQRWENVSENLDSDKDTRKWECKSTIGPIFETYQSHRIKPMKPEQE